jgi:hypothetical protein
MNNDDESPVQIDQKIKGFSVQTSEVDEGATKSTPAVPLVTKKHKRPELLPAVVLKVKAPHYNIYVVIACLNGQPFEIFFNSSHLESFEWVALATRIGSMILRSSDNHINKLEKLADEFIKTESPHRFFGKVYGNKKGSEHNGIVQFIGRNLVALNRTGVFDTGGLIDLNVTEEVAPHTENSTPNTSAGICPKCQSENTTMMDGCLTCLECGDSKCG